MASDTKTAETKGAETEAAKPDAGKTDVATTQPAGQLMAGKSAVPDFMAAQIQEDAGQGLSQSTEDNVLPLLYVLQSNSPQVDSRGPEYIKGAKPGDMWIKGSETPIDGDTGLEVQPVAFSKEWVEWTPRDAGGGYVARHATLPADCVLKADANGRERQTRPNGNEVIETRYHYVVADGSGVVIPLSSTGHTFSRDWMQKMNGIRLPNKKPAPSFSSTWKLVTKQRSNKSGKWFALAAERVGWVASLDDYEFGKMLCEQVEAGLLTAGAEDASGAGGEPTDGGQTYDPNTGEITGSTSSKADPRNAGKGQVPF